MARPLIGMGEYLKRAATIIFRKKEKDGGRDTTRLFEAIGAVMDTARNAIVQAARMMHPGTAEGAYADRWGRCLNGLYRIPGEEDEDYQARLGTAFDFWRAAGSGDHMELWLEKIGWLVNIVVHPTRWVVRRVRIAEMTGLTSCDQLVADIVKWRPAHYLYLLELLGGIAYRGVDYEYGQGTGWDARPGMDWFQSF